MTYVSELIKYKNNRLGHVGEQRAVSTRLGNISDSWIMTMRIGVVIENTPSRMDIRMFWLTTERNWVIVKWVKIASSYWVINLVDYDYAVWDGW